MRSKSSLLSPKSELPPTASGKNRGDWSGAETFKIPPALFSPWAMPRGSNPERQTAIQSFDSAVLGIQACSASNQPTSVMAKRSPDSASSLVMSSRVRAHLRDGRADRDRTSAPSRARPRGRAPQHALAGAAASTSCWCSALRSRHRAWHPASSGRPLGSLRPRSRVPTLSTTPGRRRRG